MEKETSPVTLLPDGSAFFTGSYPLPKDHWLYAEGHEESPSAFVVGIGPLRTELAEKIRQAARYAIRGATRNGQIEDFDPDALVQNLIVGLLGYWTADGLSEL